MSGEQVSLTLGITALVTPLWPLDFYGESTLVGSGYRSAFIALGLFLIYFRKSFLKDVAIVGRVWRVFLLLLLTALAALAFGYQKSTYPTGIVSVMVSACVYVAYLGIGLGIPILVQSEATSR